MSQYVAVAGSGPSAAFFDLDRTLIAGSSAFALATAARKMKMMPTQELLRDAVTAATFKFRGDHNTGAADNARDRVLGFIKGHRQDDLAALNARVLPALLGKVRPEARRLVDMHRHAGRSTYIVSAARSSKSPTRLILVTGRACRLGPIASDPRGGANTLWERGRCCNCQA